MAVVAEVGLPAAGQATPAAAVRRLAIWEQGQVRAVRAGGVMKKYISYACVIGSIWAGIAFSVVGRAGESYAELQRLFITLVFIYITVFFNMWACHPVFGKKKKPMKSKEMLIFIFFSGLLSVVIIALSVMPFVSKDNFYFLIIDNEYLALSWLAGSLAAYLSIRKNKISSD